MEEFSRAEILEVLERAMLMKRSPPGALLRGKILATCFFEPSTRTRLSFEVAMKRLGGEVIGFSDPATTSAKKGESLADTMRMIGAFADCAVIRHPEEGSARVAAEAMERPVINGGDGANEHPTQTFLDLFTIRECQGRLEELNLVFVGDLKYGRTIHSLIYALRHFPCRLFFVSPPALALPAPLLKVLEQAGLSYSCHHQIEEVIGCADILYMTRIQRERFASSEEYDALKNAFHLDCQLLQRAKRTLKVLHPLPKLDEIAPAVDTTPFAGYFTQSENGVYVRQALLSLILGGG